VPTLDKNLKILYFFTSNIIVILLFVIDYK